MINRRQDLLMMIQTGVLIFNRNDILNYQQSMAAMEIALRLHIPDDPPDCIWVKLVDMFLWQFVQYWRKDIETKYQWEEGEKQALEAYNLLCTWSG